MQKQVVLGIILGTLLFSGVTIGGYFLLVSQKDGTTALVNKPAVDVPLNSAKPATENVASNSNLQVQGASTTPNTQASQFPTPDKFATYEQFATSQTTQYQDIVVGTGLESSTGDTVAVVYKGWLTDGTLFDQNRINEEGKIVTFNFTLGGGQVIQGWEQGIFGMKEGGKRRLIIPAFLGYGEAGQGQIPPYSMLIFDVELIKVQKP